MIKLVYLSMISELIYFDLSFVAVPPLLRAMVPFASMLVLPGVAHLVALRRKLNNDLSELVVHGFFVSTLVSKLKPHQIHLHAKATGFYPDMKTNCHVYQADSSHNYEEVRRLWMPKY